MDRNRIGQKEKSLMNNTFILAIGTICSKGIVFLMVPLYSRWMTTGDYGSFDLFYTYLSVLVPVVSLSCGEAAFRFLLDTKGGEEKNRVVSTAGVVYLLGTMITVIGSAVFFTLTNTDCLVPFILLAIADILNSFVGYILRGLQKIKIYATMGIFNVFFMTVSVTVLVRFLDLGLSGILLGYAIGMLSSALFGAVSGKIWEYLSVKAVKYDICRSMIKYSAPLIPNSISWWITNGSDRFIINLFLGAAANGVYAIAYKIPSICSTLFGVFHLSWQENASLTIGDEQFTEYCNGIYNMLIKRATSIMLVVLSTNYIIFNYIIDSRYFEAYYHVPILVLSVLFSFMAQFIGGIFIALKDTKTNAATAALAALVNVTVHLLLVNSIGLYAAGVSTLISYVVLLVIRLIVSRKRIALRISTKSIPYLLVLAFCVGAQYVNYSLVNHINLLMAMVIFFFVNRDLLYEYLGSLNKIIKRR